MKTFVTTATWLLITVCLNAQDNNGLKVECRVAFTEGPAWHAETQSVYFTDIVNNRILRRDTNGQIHTYRTPSGRANGLMFDKQGLLHACEGGTEGGNHRVTRTELNGTITVLADNYQGKKFNSPNDLAIDSKGRIYFTDPRYGDRSDMQIHDDNGTPVEGVYRIDADGTVTQIITHEVDRPNGILVSPDQKTLYVADNNNSAPNTNRKLWSFSLTPEGNVVPDSRKLLFDWGNDRGPDGMCFGPNGNIYATAGLNFPTPPAVLAEKHKSGVYVFTPAGELTRFIPVPIDKITNCTFGGENGKTLFITAGHRLWSLPIE